MELLKMAADEGHAQASAKLEEMEAYDAVGRLHGRCKYATNVQV